jgi:hypothetical protein
MCRGSGEDCAVGTESQQRCRLAVMLSGVSLSRAVLATRGQNAALGSEGGRHGVATDQGETMPRRSLAASCP